MAHLILHSLVCTLCTAITSDISKWDEKGNAKMLIIQILFKEFLIQNTVICVEEKNFENFSQFQLQQFYIGITASKSVKLHQYHPQLGSGKSSMCKSMSSSSLAEGNSHLLCFSLVWERVSSSNASFLSYLLILLTIYSDVTFFLSSRYSYLFLLHVQ